MQKRPVPQYLFRVHANSDGPLDPNANTGTGRFDDFHVPARVHILYTGDRVAGSPRQLCESWMSRKK